MAMTLLTTNTSSDAASSSFTSGIDSTYKLYIFKFYNVNPATNDADFTFNFSTDGGSNYNMTKTTTLFLAEHSEGGNTGLAYRTGDDVAQGTGAAKIARGTGNEADESIAGELYLFNPSNTTYVKHFISRAISVVGAEGADDFFGGGYINSTSDVDAVQFKMDSGNMDAVIKMYGVG